MNSTTVPIPTRVMVFGMAHENGLVLADELFAVAEACGHSVEQVRSCLRRLVSEGLFMRKGSGREASYVATEKGLAALGTTMERTRLAYGQDAAGRGWDGYWRLVGFAIPEGQRGARDALRDRLIELGGANIQGGLYVSPHPWHKDAKAAAERLGLADRVTMATTEDLDVAGSNDPRELARTLWPVEDLKHSYGAFLKKFSPVPALLKEMKSRSERLVDEDFLPGALEMAVAFQDCFNRDPLLPPELLPRPWPGTEARDLVVTSRRLALAMRTTRSRPMLFRFFDEAVEVMPA
ncbi:MAG: PaaX family transcriptional regulator C-terminal domain-containing protein [Acidimicrobiales bacterium]